MLSQIQDNTYKAYVALQSYVTSPSNIPIPGIVRTDRPKLTRDQMAARYLKSVEGNPNIDINKASTQEQKKTPRMVQRSAEASKHLKELEYEPRSENKLITMERSVESVRSTCQQTVKEYIEDPSLYILRRQIQIEFVGESNPNNVCWEDIPEFVVCKNPDSFSEFWVNKPLREKILDYSHSGAMHGDQYTENFIPCDYFPDLCPTLETSPEEINLQISQTIREHPSTRVYLNQTQLDDFLKWRDDNGETENLNYTLVSDKPVSSIPLDNTPQQENHKPTSAEDNHTNIVPTALTVVGGVLTLLVSGLSVLQSRGLICRQPTEHSNNSDSSSESDDIVALPDDRDSSSESDVIVTLSDDSDSSSESDVIVSPPDVNSGQKEKQRSTNDLTNHGRVKSD